MRDLDRLTSPAVARLAATGGVLAVPVGSTEQHGPHLPLGTDTFIARELVGRICARLPHVVRAPDLALGSSGEHQSFAGTISLGRAAVHDTLLELGRSAAATFTRILLVSTHGGNAEPVTEAVRRLRYEGRDVRAWAPDWPSLAERAPDAHAGWLETSLMLAIAPELVELPLAEPGATAPVGQLMDVLRAAGVAAVSPSGVLGDPTGADAMIGERLLAGATASAVRMLDGWPAPLGPRAEERRLTAGAEAPS